MQPDRSNDAVLRHHDAVHMQPRPRQGEPVKVGAQGKSGAQSSSRNNRSNKRRRR
jgi:hypothetical protein